MDHYERVLKVAKQETPDRLPVWVSRHNKNGFDEDAKEMAAREVAFQKEYDWDMSRVSPAAALMVEGWGCRFEGNNHLGVPKVAGRPVNDPSDWEKIKELDPCAGRYGEIAKACKILAKELREEKPNLATGFSPLTLAQKLSGDQLLLDAIGNYPDMLESVLEVISRTMIDFLSHCLDSGADGLYFATQSATYNLLTDEEYNRFEKPYDLKVLNAVRPRLRLSILHLHGDNVMFDHFKDYPIDVLNWADRRTVPPLPLSEGKERFPGCVMGGINGRATLCTGTVNEVKAEIEDSIKQMAGKPFILSPCCVIPVVGVPDKNLHAIRRYVEERGV